MCLSLAKHFEGTLKRYTGRLAAWQDLITPERLQAGAGRIVRQVLTESIGVRSGRVPAMHCGTNASGGLSRVLRAINNSQFAIA